MRSKNLIDIIGMVGFLLAILVIISAFLPIPGLPRLPVEMAGLFMIYLSVGFYKPFSRQVLVIMLITTIVATFVDPAIWPLLPGQAGDAKSWVFSLGINGLVLVAWLTGYLLGSWLGKGKGN